MKKLKKNWIIILILLLIAGWFYWFQLRPVIIRKNCYSVAMSAEAELSELIKAAMSLNRDTPVESIPASGKDKNNIYRSCLIEHGLKPESIFVNLE